MKSNQPIFSAAAMALFFSFIIIFSSCSNKRASLEMQAKQAVATDIKGVTHKTIDGFTVGLGSMILDMAVSKKDQDSLILRPINPYIDKEIKTKTDAELTQLTASKKERFKFISSVIISNKDAIIGGMSEKFKYAQKFMEMATQFIQEQSESGTPQL